MSKLEDEQGNCFYSLGKLPPIPEAEPLARNCDSIDSINETINRFWDIASKHGKETKPLKEEEKTTVKSPDLP